LLSGSEGTQFTSIKDFNYPLVQYAKKTNSRIWTIEHRFYGSTQPFDKYTIENLGYLTNAQAVEDAAKFIRYIGDSYKVPKGNWIVFGAFQGGKLDLLKFKRCENSLNFDPGPCIRRK
jgi:serine protease 16